MISRKDSQDGVLDVVTTSSSHPSTRRSLRLALLHTILRSYQVSVAQADSHTIWLLTA